LALAFPNDIFASKVYKDTLSGTGECGIVCWQGAGNHKKAKQNKAKT
jgi:hypothetical protein